MTSGESPTFWICLWPEAKACNTCIEEYTYSHLTSRMHTHTHTNTRVGVNKHKMYLQPTLHDLAVDDRNIVTELLSFRQTVLICVGLRKTPPPYIYIFIYNTDTIFIYKIY